MQMKIDFQQTVKFNNKNLRAVQIVRGENFVWKMERKKKTHSKKKH